MKTFLIAAVAISFPNPVWAGEQDVPVQAGAQQEVGDQGEAKRNDNTVVPADSKAAPEAKDPNRKICRKEEVIGTRLGYKRVCATAAEWARMRAEHQQSTELVQNGKFTFDGE